MGKDSGNSATQITDIPEWARPYSRALLDTTAQLASTPYTSYPGMKTAPQNAAQLQALGMTAGTALYGSPDTNAARGSVVGTLQGNYSNPWASALNPYMTLGNPQLTDMINQSNDAIKSQYMNATAPQTDQAAQMQGAWGGGGYNARVTANQEALAKQLGQNTSNLLFQDYSNKSNLTESALQRGSAGYEAERARQMQAIQYGLQGSGLDFTAAQKLGAAGDAQNTYLQNLINEGVSDFQAQQQYPWLQLDRLGAGLGKALGGSSSTTVTNSQGGQPSLVSNALAGGLAGYGLNQMGAMGSYAPWLGAGIGAISSFF